MKQKTFREKHLKAKIFSNGLIFLDIYYSVYLMFRYKIIYILIH